MYEDCVEKFNCNRYPGHCNPVCYRPIGQHNEPGVNSYKCCTCFPEVVEVFPMDRIWEGPAGRDGKDGASLEFAWEGTRLKVRVKGTEEWVYSTSLLGMQGPKGDTGEKGETGAIGPRGYTGAPGQDGDPGADGNGVDYVELHSSSGIVKTYRMHFTDGTYFDFTVTDGIDGINGQDGEGVVEGGTTGQVLKKKSNDDFDTEWVDYAYDDLSGRPKINNITLSGNKSLSDLGIKQTYNKSDVGLGNVDNVRQYSVNNPPPYPVTSVNGNTGAVVIDTHDDLIPTQASSSNKLATEGFVNSTVATSTATFRGTYDSLAELEQVSADENDYGFVVDVDSAGNTVYNRYKYASGTWTFEYALNNSSFTAAQWEAIQSGITDDLVTKLQGIEAGAEVNIVEGLKIGNVTQQVSSKIMQINPDTTPMQGSNNVIDSNAVYEVEKLLPTDRESGESVDIDNAQPYKVMSEVIDGKYQQESTTGYNILPITLESGTYNGVQVTKNSDGSITLNGTATRNFNLDVYADTTGMILNGDYTFYLIGKNTRINLQGVIDGTSTAFIPFSSTSEAIPKNYDTDATLTKVFSYLNTTNTYTNETFYYMVIKGNDTTKPYEPYTNGASPNPDYSQPITQITSMTWNRTGKQLFQLEYISNPGSTKNAKLTAGTYTIATCDGLGFMKNMYFKLYQNGSIITNSGHLTSSTNLSFSNSSYAYYGGAAVSKITFTIDDDYELNIGLLEADGTRQVMLVAGSTEDRTYEPYQGQTIPIDLDGNEVCSVGTIKDKLLVDRYGNVAIQKNVGKVVLNGSESGWAQNNVGVGKRNFISMSNILCPSTASELPKVISNYFISDTPSRSWSQDINCVSVNSTSQDLLIKTKTDMNLDTIVKFKTWLSMHNTTVYYALATPQTIPLPKLSTLPTTLKGINHTWVDTNLGITDIEVEYVEDLSLAIPTKTSDLTNDSGYVKNTDYATTTTGGVIVVSAGHGTSMSNDGKLRGVTKTYAQYQAADNLHLISKIILENVLTERIGTIETALTTLDVGGGVQ